MTSQPLIPTPNRPLQVMSRFIWWFRRPLLLPRVRRPVIETSDGLLFAIIPTVFNPVVFRAGVMLGRAAGALGAPKAPNQSRALDMGCGTGIVGAYLARNGFDVVSADSNPDAVRVARANAILNKLDDKVTVIESDLFSALDGQMFDVICFGPPYFKGPPKDDRLSKAFWSENLMEKFARLLPAHLKAGGTVLIHLSTDGDSEGMLTPAAEEGFDISIFRRINYHNEIMTVYRLKLAQ